MKKVRVGLSVRGISDVITPLLARSADSVSAGGTISVGYWKLRRELAAQKQEIWF